MQFPGSCACIPCRDHLIRVDEHTERSAGKLWGCLHVLERGPPIRIVAGIYLDAIAIGIVVIEGSLWPFIDRHRRYDAKCLEPRVAPQQVIERQDYSWVLLMCSEYRESRQIALEGLAVLTGGKKANPCASLAQTNGATAAYLDELFLGEWGEALREIDSTLVTLTKNGNEVWAHALRFWRAYLNIQAMDFSGARMICESAVRALGDAITAPDRRWYLAVAGTAEVALGNYEGGLQHLSAARREMDQRKVMNDWYTRLLVESALTELWLSKDDIAQARVQAEQFLRVTLATRERTFRALAWQANARVAMADADQARAQVCVAHALSAMEGFEVPLAEWRVHATACTFEEMRGDLTAAAQHRELSRAAILKIAHSLGPAEPLRAIFLSAPPVVHILGSPVAG